MHGLSRVGDIEGSLLHSLAPFTFSWCCKKFDARVNEVDMPLHA